MFESIFFAPLPAERKKTNSGRLLFYGAMAGWLLVYLVPTLAASKKCAMESGP